MEILGRYTAFLLLFIMVIGSVHGQTTDETIKAFEESYEFEANGDYASAVNVLKEVYNEDSYELSARLGWLNYMAGSFTESIAYYQKSIKLKPYSLEARFGIVYPASALGNWSSVVTQYNKILEIDSQNTVANYRLGMIYYGKEEFEKSSKYFEKVVNLYPFDYDSMIMFAWAQLNMGKLREAEVLFNKVLLINPGDKSATEGLGLIK